MKDIEMFGNIANIGGGMRFIGIKSIILSIFYENNTAWFYGNNDLRSNYCVYGEILDPVSLVC